MHFLARLVACISVVLPLASVPLQADELGKADTFEFQRIISSQIEAFRNGDGVSAYSYAAPAIKKLFPSPDIFMQMVRSGYQPVVSPQRFAFGEMDAETPGRPTQRVEIIDSKGKAWTALYTFEKQPDGSWKIVGCALIESQGGEA